MNITAPQLNPRRALLLAILALGALLFAASPASAYDWPVRPFDRQHPVRGFFGDPRIGGGRQALHWGVDVAARNGTPVYAIEAGTVVLYPGCGIHVLAPNGHELAYWHIAPTVRSGQWVRARQRLGRIEAPWAHVHLGERVAGIWLNPLRRGALAPYRDTTRPWARDLSVERDGVPLARRRASGAVDLVVEAYDETPVAVPAPWNAKPVTPALVRWRVLGAAGPLGRLRVAVDFTRALPTVDFDSVYANRTRQNLASRRGRYRFVLAHGWDTRALSDGCHLIEVVVSDTAGNTGRSAHLLTVANGR